METFFKESRIQGTSRLLRNSPSASFSTLPATDSRQIAGFVEKRGAFLNALLERIERIIKIRTVWRLAWA